MKSPRTLLSLAAAFGLAHAATISSDFSGSTGNVSLPYVDKADATNNGNRTVTRSNFAWTETDSSSFSLRGLNNLDMGNFTWGSAGTPISAGRIFTTMTGGRYNTGTSGAGTNSQIRSTGTTDPTRARIQFNSGTVGASSATAPADLAIWNLLVEFGGSTSYTGLDFSFRAGTAQTNGAFDNNTLANNGNYNISLTPVSLSGSNGTLSTGSKISAFGTPQAIGAGQGPTLTPSWDTGAISPGVYLLHLEFSGQGTQRNSIADFSVTAIPEPGTLALVGAALLCLLALRRR